LDYDVGILIIADLLRALVFVLVGIIVSILSEKIFKSQQKLKESEEKYREAYNLVNFYKDLFAHDMNNILQSILSSAEYYSRFRDDPEKLKCFGDISEILKMHTGRGVSLISNVIKLSELDESEIILKPIGVFDVLNKSVENAKKSFYQKNKINIKTEGLSKDMKILGDELLIDIFDNILNNAVKFSDDKVKEDIIDIIISKIRVEDINYLKFEFKDRGSGIPDDRKETLFERPYERDRRKRGMGMGLSLVKKIVDKYDGKIWVEDRIKENHNEGSNFVVLLKESD
jgi:signal transduction histidine kinase